MHMHTLKKKQGPFVCDQENKGERWSEKEHYFEEMSCCLHIFGPGGCMGVTHKHNDSAVETS